MYSNDELFRIKNSKDAKGWKDFVFTKNEWDYKNAPFELDDELRGIPFNQQIRIIRDREIAALRKRQEELHIIKPVEDLGKMYPSGVVGEKVCHSSLPLNFPCEPQIFNQQIIEFVKNIKKNVYLFVASDYILFFRGNEKSAGPKVFPRASSSSSNTLQILQLLTKQEPTMEEKLDPKTGNEGNHFYDTYANHLLAKLNNS